VSYLSTSLRVTLHQRREKLRANSHHLIMTPGAKCKQGGSEAKLAAPGACP